MSSSETDVQQTATAVPTGGKAPKKNEKKSSAASKQAKPSHPPTSDMVNNAIKSLKERSGSSLQAIKKYIAANYKVDPEKLAPFIKKYLKGAVQSGSLVQTKGKGASGSFKLSAGGSSTGTQKKTKAKRVTKAVDGSVKKSTSTAKSADKKKSKVPAVKSQTAGAKSKKAATTSDKKAPKATKSPSKAKKTAKSPTKKPKAPKPKTVKTTAPKKAASPKRKK